MTATRRAELLFATSFCGAGATRTDHANTVSMTALHGSPATSLSAGVRTLGAAAGDLLLGACCPGCAVPGWGLCAACRFELGGWRPRRVRPDPCPDGFPVTVSTGPYAGLASALITAHKDRQALALAGVLGRLLASSVELLLADTAGTRSDRVVLVPAPSSARASRDRGLDAGRAIARSAVRHLGGPDRPPVVVRSWLRQRRGVRDQAALNAQQRADNLAGALCTTRTMRPRAGDAVVVVDDVVTTGATLTEAVRALHTAGNSVLGAATVAATSRWGSADPTPEGRLSDD
jgi:predicted amidophosphoribosyltransferase